MNQVRKDYNGFGQLTADRNSCSQLAARSCESNRSHSGAVVTTAGATQTPRVQYAYSTPTSTANHARLTSMTYPNGRVITYDYDTAGSLNDSILRLKAIKGNDKICGL